MNEELYNQQVASFQENVKKHEDDIIRGRKIARNLEEFNTLFDEYMSIRQDYKQIEETLNENASKSLEAYLKDTLESLNTIESLFTILNDYHQFIGYENIKQATIIHEWKDLHAIVYAKYLNRLKTRIQKLLVLNPEQYQEKYNEIESRFKEISNDTSNAIANMMNRADKLVVNDMKNIKEFNEQTREKVETSSIKFDEEKFWSFDIYGQIDYITWIMQNIEKLKGEKTIVEINGETKKINVKYVALYQKYCAILDNLERKKIEQEEKIIGEVEQQLNFNAEEEKKLTIIQQNLENQVDSEHQLEECWPKVQEVVKYVGEMKTLESKARGASEKETIDVYDIFDDEIITILKTDNKTFKKISKKLTQLSNDLDLLTENLTEEDKKKLYNKMQSALTENLNNSADVVPPTFYSLDEVLELNDKKTKIWGLITDLSDKAKALNGNANNTDVISLDTAYGTFLVLATDQTEFENYMEQFVELDYLTSPEKQKEAVINSLNFLKENTNPGEERDNQIQALIEKYYNINNKNQKIKKRNLLQIFKNAGYSKDESEYFIKVCMHVDDFQKSKKVSKVEKKQVLNLIWKALFNSMHEDDLLDNDVEEKVQDESPVINIKRDNEPVKEKSKFNFKPVDIAKNVAKAMGSLSEKVVTKIKQMKKPKDKKQLAQKIKKMAPMIATSIAMTVPLFVTGYAVLDHSTNQNKTDNIQKEANNEDITQFAEDLGKEVAQIANQIVEEKEEEETIKEEVSSPEIEQTSNEEKPLTFADIENGFTVNEDADIFSNQYDAYNDANAKDAYFSADSYRVPSGISYSYNGDLVFLSTDDPEFEAKRQAYENNGAVIESVRSQNEFGQGNGSEGYFQLEDININEKGQTR